MLARWNRVLAPIWRAIPEWVQWRVMWLVNAKFTVGVTGVIFDGAGRVLLAEHVFRGRYPWGLVSGWVHHREPLEQALAREVSEETGFQVRAMRLFAVRAHPRVPAVEVVYVCEFAGGAFRPSDEIATVRWCTPDALPPTLHPDHRPLITAAAAAAANPLPEVRTP